MPLRPVPCGDEFAYVDTEGRPFVSHGLLNKLDEVEGLIADTRRAGAGRTPDHLMHARQMLLHDWNFGAFGHEHRHDLNAPPRRDQPIDVPEHCGWPMRLTPTGWACRRCPHRGAAFDGLALLAAG
jgi:hypothetical protein